LLTVKGEKDRTQRAAALGQAIAYPKEDAPINLTIR
jgi:hypothetical protein